MCSSFIPFFIFYLKKQLDKCFLTMQFYSHIHNLLKQTSIFFNHTFCIVLFNIWSVPLIFNNQFHKVQGSVWILSCWLHVLNVQSTNKLNQLCISFFFLFNESKELHIRWYIPRRYYFLKYLMFKNSPCVASIGTDA